MTINLKSANIISAIRGLKGNSRPYMATLPMFTIPYAIYNFYLGLYMKSQGITDEQMGYIISAGFISGAFFALFGGFVTDNLGRKKTTLIFDLLSWPLSALIFALSGNFWMFVLGAVVNSSVRIVVVSFNMMIVEDSNPEQIITTYNIQSILNLSAGIFVPMGGLVVKALGVVAAERIFMFVAVVSMTSMMLIRHRISEETSIGRKLLEERKGRKIRLKDVFRQVLHFETFRELIKKPVVVMAVLLMVIFSVFFSIGSLSSLYFAPYATEVLKIDSSLVSVLGSVNSGIMLIIFLFVNPVINKLNRSLNMIAGLFLQVLSMFLLITLAKTGLFASLLAVVCYAVGFSVFKPSLDALLAEVTEGATRAGVYSLVQTLICLSTAVIASFSGILYEMNPANIYILSIGMLLAGVLLLVLILKIRGSGKSAVVNDAVVNTEKLNV